MPPFIKLLTRFRKDERGVFGVIFGIIAVVLVTLAGCVVDFSYMQTIRSRAQNALDASALALQAKMSTLTDDEIKTQAQALLTERLADSTITSEILSVTSNDAAGTLNLKAHIRVPTIFVQLVGVRNLDASLVSEVTQNSSNLEVAIALDNTGSMGGTKIQNLIDATKTLIGLLVKDQQPPAAPTYSKMALVPYSYGVNVGPTLAPIVRGPVTGAAGVNISNVTWMASGSPYTITKINKNSNATVTAPNNFANGDKVIIYNITTGGMTSLNGGIYTVASATATSFKIGVNTSAFGTFSGTGRVAKCADSPTDCDVTVTTSTTHGFAANAWVHVENTVGFNSLNGGTYQVAASPTATTLKLLGSAGGGGGAWTSGGQLYCTLYKCPWYRFDNNDGNTSTFITLPLTNCVTERVLSHKYDDTLASNPDYAGYMYPETPVNCVAQQMVPLTSDKTALTATVNAMTAAGSTAGQIGLAWAWYAISPNFNTLWPASSAAAYHAVNTIKAVILMTDGQFNTQYFNGVIAKDSYNANGNSYNGNSSNGDSTTQATTLCTNIKASGGPDDNTQLFTVGFDIGDSSAASVAARTFLNGCATDDPHFYLAITDDDGASLTAAFQAIAKNLSDLRLSK